MKETVGKPRARRLINRLLRGIISSFTGTAGEEQAEIEAALGAASEKGLELAALSMEKAGDAIIIHDFDGKILYANEAAQEVTGRAAGELFSMRIHEVEPPDRAKQIEERLERIKMAEKAIFETEFVGKDGAISPMEVNSRALKLPDKLLIVSVARDVTGRTKGKELSDSLNDINMTINSTLEFDEIMRRVIVEATKTIGAETGGIALRENARWVVRYIFGLPKAMVGFELSHREARHLALAAKTKGPVAVNEAHSDPRVDRDLIKKLGVKSLLAVPLILRGNAIGAMSFHHHSRAVPFAEIEIDFAGKVGAAVSLAIENARLYETERDISNTLQQALLTIPEEIPGLGFGQLYRSATGAAKVGGDFYDLIELEHDRVGILIGDVSGKGLEAASTTSFIKNTIKAYAYEDISPASVIAKANEAFRRTSTRAAFATVFFGVLDTKTGILSYCSAGHPPAILRKRTSEIVLLSTRSPFIGAFTGLNFVEQIEMVERGDILFLYTDGATEARREGEFFGEHRLVNCLKECALPVEEVPKLVFDEIMSFTGGRLADDVALLAVSLEHRAYM